MRKSLLALAVLASILTGCKTKNPVLTIEGGYLRVNIMHRFCMTLGETSTPTL